MDKTYQALLGDIRNHLIFHELMGITHYPSSPALQRFLEQPEKVALGDGKGHRGRVSQPGETPAKKISKPTVPPPTPLQLQDIRNDLGDCRRCPLWERRRHIVFGEGSAQARLIIIGDQTDGRDDEMGRPFSGDSGELLDKMLHAIGLARKEVYCAHIVKCATPEGRTPKQEEISTCLPFLEGQIRAIQPKLLCTMGFLSSRILTQSDKSLFRLRGRLYTFRGIPLIPTFHPAYLMKHEEMKRPAWVDLQMIQRTLSKE